MIVTVDYLESLRACSNQVEVFTTTFGESVEVTRESLTRAYGAGLDLDWFGRNAFGKAYREAIAPAGTVYLSTRNAARKVYDEVRDTAWKVYEKEVDTAGDACDEARGMAWEVYVEARATAWKVYNEAIAPAEKTCHEACVLAWKVYREAFIEVILKLSQVTITP